jgi:hypothetical protein
MPATIKGVSGFRVGRLCTRTIAHLGNARRLWVPKPVRLRLSKYFPLTSVADDARTSSIGSLVPRTVIWPIPPIHSLKMPLSPVPVASASVAQRIGRQGAHSTNFFLNHTQMDPESL